MLLILDDNEFRRKSLLVKLRMKKLVVSCQPMEHHSFLTKPIITLYINPSLEVIGSLCQSDDVVVVAKNNLRVLLPGWIKQIPLDDNVYKHIERIYEEEISRDKAGDLDIFGKVVFKGNEVGVAGKRITFTDTEIRILKMFYFNYKKKFTDTEASSYFRYLENPEQNFTHAVHMINSKCKKVGRKALILKEEGRFSANPGLYIAKPVNLDDIDPNIKVIRNKKVHI